MARARRSSPVVDGDGHVIEPPNAVWWERMDRAKWGDWIPHFDFEEQALCVGGVPRAGGLKALSEAAALAGITLEEVQEATGRNRLAMARPGGHDPHARVADMDRDGIDLAVLYPTAGLLFGPLDPIEALRRPDFVAACQRAYNDWIAEFCAAEPRRLFGVGSVPLQDLDLAVAEAERVARRGLVGVWIRPAPYLGELPLSHAAYDRFWAACQDLDLSVSLHPAVHVDTPGACRKFALVRENANLAFSNVAVSPEYGGSGFGQAIGNTVDMIVSLGRLLMGGVCERFPRLRFLFLEAGGGWCATQLERMDEQVEAFPLEGRWLALKPSEYFRRQCYISFEPEEWNLAASARQIGADRVIWASDYPHPEYHPGVVGELREHLAGLSADDRSRILGKNAIEAYRLPVSSGS